MSVGFVIFISIICGIVAAIVMSSKGRSEGAGFFLGFFLSVIGLFIAFVLPKNENSIKQRKIASGEMKECPACKSLVSIDATKCKYCTSDLPETDNSIYDGKKWEDAPIP